MQRLPWHQSISLTLSSWSTGGRTTSPSGSIPSCCTNNTRYGQPCNEKVGSWDGICDPGHLPLQPISRCLKRLSVALSVPSVEAITLCVRFLHQRTCPDQPSGFSCNSCVSLYKSKMIPSGISLSPISSSDSSLLHQTETSPSDIIPKSSSNPSLL
jgi:hypothetical protein